MTASCRRCEQSAVLDRYHTPDFELINDGVPLDRKRLIDHVTPTRKRVIAVHVQVEQALADGDQVAARTRLGAGRRRRIGR